MINKNINIFDNINIDFSITNLKNNQLLSLNELNTKKYLKNKLLIFNISNNIISYHNSNISFINENTDIIPLTYCIANKNSSFSINNSYQYFVNIDNQTIIDNNHKLYGSYLHIPIAKNNIYGRFSYNEQSLDTINILSYNTSKTLLTINNDILNQITDINNTIKSTYISQKFQKYNTYLMQYADLNRKFSHPVFQYDNYEDIILNKKYIIYKDPNHLYYINLDDTNNLTYIIDIDIISFGLIFTFNYKYESTKNFDYNNYNNYIKNFIKTIQYHSNLQIDENNSFIYNIKKINYEFNEITKNLIITSQFNYKLTFNILSKDIETMYIIINDININFLQKTKLNSLDKVGEIIYYDKYNGFNFNKDGEKIGLCLYPRNFFNNENQIIHENSENITYNPLVSINNDLTKYKKPIYIKLKNNLLETITISNINKYIDNNISFSNNRITIYQKETSGSNISFISTLKVLCNNSNTFDNLTYYTKSLIIDPYYIDNETKKYLNEYLYTTNNLYTSWEEPSNNISYISPFITTNQNNLFRYFNYSNNEQNINYIYNLNYNNILSQFDINNDEILGYNNIYLPSIYDLCVFYGFNLQYYINSSSFESINSKLFYKINNNIYNYSLNKNTKFELQLIDEESLFNSIILFTIPDINILYSDKYYMFYDKDKKYILIDYLQFSSTIDLNIQIFGISETLVKSNSNMLIRLTDINNKGKDPKNYYINTIYPYNFELNELSNNKLSFNLYNYFTSENVITIYYQDSNINLNTEEIEGKNYRILCKIHIKK